MRSFQLASFAFVVALASLATFGATTGCDSSGGSCDLSAVQWSVADSGDLCQANIFVDSATTYGVYCGELPDGTFDCGCGARSDDPPRFNSATFCDLDGEARVCEAIAQCGFTL